MSKPKTLAALGCGTLATAIVSGIVSSLKSTPQSSHPAGAPHDFLALITRQESAERIHRLLPDDEVLHFSISVSTQDHVECVGSADMVLLGCKPYMVGAVLGQAGMREALAGKLLISICAGVKIDDLKTLVDSTTKVVRVMPNTASMIRESMTVISPAPEVTEEEKQLVLWMFSNIGRAMVLPEKNMDVATAVCGSGPAFCALVLEGLTDGGVLMGVPRPAAQEMAAQVMLGTAKLVLNGQDPAVVKQQVSTPAGCTIRGLMVMEDRAVRGAVARTIEEATNIAGGLGGKK